MGCFTTKNPNPVAPVMCLLHEIQVSVGVFPQPKLFSVCLSLADDKPCLYNMLSCHLLTTPPPHLPSCLYLSCLDAFPHQQVILKVKTLLSEAMPNFFTEINDPSFFRPAVNLLSYCIDLHDIFESLSLKITPRYL